MSDAPFPRTFIEMFVNIWEVGEGIDSGILIEQVSPAEATVKLQDGEFVAGAILTVEKLDVLIRELAAVRVAIQPPTIPEKPVRNPRQPNVPDNADALARVAKSNPERIDGDEK